MTEKFSKDKDLLYIRYKLHGKLLTNPFWKWSNTIFFFFFDFRICDRIRVPASIVYEYINREVVASRKSRVERHARSVHAVNLTRWVPTYLRLISRKRDCDGGVFIVNPWLEIDNDQALFFHGNIYTQATFKYLLNLLVIPFSRSSFFSFFFSSLYLAVSLLNRICIDRASSSSP